MRMETLEISVVAGAASSAAERAAGRSCVLSLASEL